MAPKQKKQPSTQPSGTSADALTLKLPRTAWKTGEQLEYLISHWSNFVIHQNAGTLDRFWPRVYEPWYKKWPPTPTPQNAKKMGASEATLLVRTETNQRIRTWFHNQARPTSKASKSDLRLGQNEKRKLAPAQAYCSYAWESGLKEIVIARWEQQKRSHMSADEDDPTPGSVETPGPDSHIPIDFKLRIAKEIYNNLSPEEKKAVDDRRETERKRQYRQISDITDVEERDQKLAAHKQNQPSVAKTLMRALKNLEDQAGCVAHLIIGYIDPAKGTAHVQNYSQGQTGSTLGFKPFCGEKWEDAIEPLFKDWAVTIFGEPGSSRRSTFMFSNASPGGEGVASSSAEGITRPRASTTVDPDRTSPETNTIAVGGVIGTSTIASLPQTLGTMEVVLPQTPIPSLVNNQPSTSEFRSPESPAVTRSQGLDRPQTVAPHQLLVSPVVPEVPFIAPSPVLGPSQTTMLQQVNVPLVVPDPPLFTPSPVLESSQAVTPNQPITSPMVPESPAVTRSQVLDRPQTVAPHQLLVSPMVPEVPYLVAPSPSQTTMLQQINVPLVVPEPPLFTPSPVLEGFHAATPDQPIASSTVPKAPHLASPSVALGSSQTVIPDQLVVSSVVPELPLVFPHPILGLEPSRVNNLQDLADRHEVSDPPQVIHTQQTVAPECPSDPAKGTSDGNSGAAVAIRGTYKPQIRTSVTATNRPRRDSTEGAPDIILTLGGSGYELVTPSAQSDISTVPSPTTPVSPALLSDEFNVPSSQQSLEEFLTIPAEFGKSTSSTPSTDELTVPLSPQSLEGTSTTPTTSVAVNITSDHIRFAPRRIPDYSFDRSDFPSWLSERDRLDYVLSVEAGEIWGKLITAWLRQERSLGFGLNDKIGVSLPMRRKPQILKDYFKWHHNPSKGDSIRLPEFGNEVSDWWSSIQPEWRRSGGANTSNTPNDYSYILAGGKKGVFLLILCLAWWDRAYGRGIEKEKAERREAARAAGKDETTLDFSDILEYETKWFTVVNDLIFVLGLAEALPVPGEDTTPGAVGAVPIRKKRAAEGSDTTPRKKKKTA